MKKVFKLNGSLPFQNVSVDHVLATMLGKKYATLKGVWYKAGSIYTLLPTGQLRTSNNQALRTLGGVLESYGVRIAAGAALSIAAGYTAVELMTPDVALADTVDAEPIVGEPAPVDAEPVVHAYWEKVYGYVTPGGDPVWVCSNCGKGVHIFGAEAMTYNRDISDNHQWVSCPNCGAKMDGEK